MLVSALFLKGVSNLEYFIFTSNKTTVKIRLNDIVYVITAAKPHQLKIFTSTRIYLTYGKLRWFKDHSKHLIFCNRSCIINLNDVLSIEKSTRKITFKTDIDIPITCSRNLYKAVKAAWLAI
ncbi:LytTR family DNA-binding domain-containing protein [Lactiplantibacillus pentosus]|jgi:DNA-binding LytR/AlgR family response regulator|uniref:LytTR family DNA-binding domain-containing protein n=1 Tax=Lactiplantibacillus pentosus TaxID=1589 RepID=UPI001CFFF18D|nr:LytTR family transcriptional regulator DNA-binding domain-containing protein [Lactiplantibacillus pentosus]MCT3288661.1 LytTR family transcriptional regulator [Lactiplantibacillus pentosus]